VVERDVVGERAGQHPRHLADVGDLAGPQERLRVVDLAVVPLDAALVVDEAGERGQQARLARPDLADEQHEVAGVDGEVDVAHADRAVVVDGGEPPQRQPLQRHAWRGRR
jgi:hypothetical protein